MVLFRSYSKRDDLVARIGEQNLADGGNHVSTKCIVEVHCS